MIYGVTHTWCGCCADYKPDHGTEDNAEKILHYKPNSQKGREQAARAAALRATTKGGGSSVAPAENPQTKIPTQP
eukprot:3089818-Ditylum_brightwellii.AAC.1